MDDEPTPIAYTGLTKGVPVQTRDGETFGSVDSVLAIPEEDLFDGIVVDTDRGRRFVDADQVGPITTSYVRTTLSADEAQRLPKNQSSPVYDVDPSQDSGRSISARLGRLFGRGKWRRKR